MQFSKIPVGISLYHTEKNKIGKIRKIEFCDRRVTFHAL